MSLVRLALALALALGPAGRASAGPRLRARAAAAPRPDAAVARAPFEPPAFDAVFDRAVRSVRAEGYELTACEAERGALATRPREFDARCGNTTCLVRQSLSVILGHRAARVTISREVFDTAVRQWVPAAVDDVEPEAARLVTAIASAEPPPRAGPPAEHRRAVSCADGDRQAAREASTSGAERPASPPGRPAESAPAS